MKGPPGHVLAMRDRFRESILANAVRPDGSWGQTCHAFNLQVDLETPALGQLARVQAELARLDHSLLAVPTTAMHLSVDWLLEVDREYDEPKIDLWERHGEHWTEELAAIAAVREPFGLTYRWLAVTDTAVVALAEPTHDLQGLRAHIRRRVVFPGQARPMASIAHTTLFRFGAALSDPAGLVRAAEELELHAHTVVRELIISEEIRYPSLTTVTRARLPLGGAGRDPHGLSG